MRAAGWSHEKILPIVRQAIYNLCLKNKGWVTREDIVKALENNAEACSIAANAASLGMFNGDMTKIIGNMVDMMNLWLTESERGKAPDAWDKFARETLDMFERRKIDGKWAFKLRK
ncbi:MAG: hypothetical protein QXZ70_06660 [Candidatus Bathyarchaeia archaeon]